MQYKGAITNEYIIVNTLIQHQMLEQTERTFNIDKNRVVTTNFTFARYKEGQNQYFLVLQLNLLSLYSDKTY